jgi:hypothetical protein
LAQKKTEVGKQQQKQTGEAVGPEENRSGKAAAEMDWGSCWPRRKQKWESNSRNRLGKLLVQKKTEVGKQQQKWTGEAVGPEENRSGKATAETDWGSCWPRRKQKWESNSRNRLGKLLVQKKTEVVKQQQKWTGEAVCPEENRSGKAAAEMDWGSCWSRRKQKWESSSRNGLGKLLVQKKTEVGKQQQKRTGEAVGPEENRSGKAAAEMDWGSCWSRRKQKWESNSRNGLGKLLVQKKTEVGKQQQKRTGEAVGPEENRSGKATAEMDWGSCWSRRKQKW